MRTSTRRERTGGRAEAVCRARWTTGYSDFGKEEPRPGSHPASGRRAQPLCGRVAAANADPISRCSREQSSAAAPAPRTSTPTRPPSSPRNDHRGPRDAADKNLEFLGLGGSGYVYKCAGGFACKVLATQREVDFMKAAGDCSAAPLSRVMGKVDGGVLVPCGLIMELATPFQFKLVPADERRAVMDEMVGLVERLHGPEFGIVHGDIKPANLLRCRDGRLRLCDFDSARFVADEEAEGWEAFISDRYLAPSRGFPDYGPPTVLDDDYAFASSVWELFTGKDAFIDEDMEDVLREGRTVDLDELEDDEIRDFVRKRLRDGGAKV
ncbi:kinase-like domain-containing protein [Chaetomium strumarium]|uniref:Kinase-like domain-containing protein n=1 Tax=Chaetomium strumarium TaxID=1170767 RepID=A0AAJ0GZE5_9PEZI|nr:kinase-like domain-containing protein [Chaetomium strumarium]